MDASSAGKPRKKQRSCLPCALAKRSCDHGSPCSRCVAKGLECVIGADKRTKMYAGARERGSGSLESSSASSSDEVDAHTPSLDAEAGAEMRVDSDTTRRAGRKRCRDESSSSSSSSSPALSGFATQEHVRDVPHTHTRTHRHTHILGAGGRRQRRTPDSLISTSSASELDLAPETSSDEDPLGLLGDASALTHAHADLALRDTIARPLVRTPFSSLEDRIIRALGQSCERRRNIMFSFPAVPLGVPYDVLRALSGPDGRVHVHTLTRAAATPRMAMEMVADSMVSVEGLFESTLMMSLARSPVPSLRIVFQPPEVFDITCESNLRPRLVYGNRAWLYMFMVCKFVPEPYRPAAGQRLDVDVAAAALRLCAALAGTVPASVLLGKPRLTPGMIRNMTDAELVEAFEDGCILPVPDTEERVRNHVAEAFRVEYFRTVAQSLVLRRQYHRIRTRIQLKCFLHRAAAAEDICSPALADIPPAMLDVLAPHPRSLELLQLLPSSPGWDLDTDEVVNINYSPLGVLSSISIIYQNSVMTTSLQPVSAADFVIVPQRSTLPPVSVDWAVPPPPAAASWLQPSGALLPTRSVSASTPAVADVPNPAAHSVSAYDALTGQRPAYIRELDSPFSMAALDEDDHDFARSASPCDGATEAALASHRNSGTEDSVDSDRMSVGAIEAASSFIRGTALTVATAAALTMMPLDGFDTLLPPPSSMTV